MTFSFQRPHSKSHRQRQRERVLSSAVRVKCKFCGNAFMAEPEKAVCQKCGRPANRALAAQWRTVSFFLPLIGIGNAVLIRPHSPVASNQGFVASALGTVGYGALYYAAQVLMHL